MDALKGHFRNGCAQGSIGNGCAQQNRLFRRMYATIFWATDARKVWLGKSQMRATCFPDAGNLSNLLPLKMGEEK